MPLWIIEPRDSLIVRDGRPFGPDPGVRATSLEFPFPSTLAGGARNRFGLAADGLFERSEANLDRVRDLIVHGPLLVEIVAPDEQLVWYGPAPADALVTDVEDKVQVLAVEPMPMPAGSESNGPHDLLPIGARAPFPAKLSTDPPRFWHWDSLEDWLHLREAASWLGSEAQVEPAKLGIGRLPRDRRMHVSIEPGPQTALDGALFQTSGLSFTLPGRRRFALAVRASADFPHFAGGLAPLAGERRVVTWRPRTEDFPECPSKLAEAIATSRACRALLMTPALFDAGYRPAAGGPLLRRSNGVTITLRAAAVPRPQVVSGWDVAANSFQGEPKSTRRLAPSGAVYYLRFEGAHAAIEAWVRDHWMQPISDRPEDCADGFGLAVFGVWPGADAIEGGTNDA